jgi:EAL domain-containing protein (putative c-di-GMP-specific phosphodiesterase class I)
MAVYGPFALHSAFQPIFRRMEGGRLRLDAFEGLLRPLKNGTPSSPFAFFAAVELRDRGLIDAVCRRLHLRNLAVLARRDTALFLNFDPSLFADLDSMRREAFEVAGLAEETGLPPARIVCEITEKTAPDRRALLAVVEAFRGHGFRIAVDDYGAEDSDIERVALLKPDIVKFDREWLLRYMEHGPGVELLRDTTRRFQENGITTLFEGLEHDWHVDLSLDLGVDLLQGYALARPEMLPTRFNEMFPEEAASADPEAPARLPLASREERAAERRPAVKPQAPEHSAAMPLRQPKPQSARPVFGRRGR